MALPEGFHYTDDSDFSGWDRQPWNVENVAEIEMWFKEAQHREIRQPSFTCNYCGDHRRTASLDHALGWWRAHDCKTLEAAEASALVIDLLPLAGQRRAAHQNRRAA